MKTFDLLLSLKIEILLKFLNIQENDIPKLNVD